MRFNQPGEVQTDWVFGYGSLIWNPGFDFDRSELARVHGYHRSFCLRSTRYRGTPQQPGVVLGLDRGGSCTGIAFRMPARSREQSLARLFEREIPDPANRIYLACQIQATLGSGERVQALAFVADRSASSYQRLDDREILRRLSGCHGLRGPNRDYALNTWRALCSRGVEDARLARYARVLLGADPPA